MSLNLNIAEQYINFSPSKDYAAHEANIKSPIKEIVNAIRELEKATEDPVTVSKINEIDKRFNEAIIDIKEAKKQINSIVWKFTLMIMVAFGSFSVIVLLLLFGFIQSMVQYIIKLQG